MIYDNIVSGTFLNRPNRFISNVEIDNTVQVVHVKNTGRCKEILIPNAKVYLQKSANPNRKTDYDLIAALKGNRLINIDSQIPNAVAEEWIKSGHLFNDLTYLKREVTYENSRFDMFARYGDKKAFIEVKGVTLESNGVMLFPDAPTERGVKHLKELIKCRSDGYEAYILFVIQTENVLYFKPNSDTHPEFAEMLKQAYENGVHVLAYDCIVNPDSIVINKFVEVKL